MNKNLIKNTILLIIFFPLGVTAYYLTTIYFPKIFILNNMQIRGLVAPWIIILAGIIIDLIKKHNNELYLSFSKTPFVMLRNFFVGYLLGSFILTFFK